MNSLRTLSIALAAATLFGNPALSQEGGLTREQVRAELAEARRNGDLRTGGETGLRMRDKFPGLYPAEPAAPAPKSRQQVRRELEQARADGSMTLAGETGLTEAELAPHRFAARPALFAKTRDEVKAELATARRLGDMPAGEDSRTLAEAHPQAYAAVRAQHLAAAKTPVAQHGSTVAAAR
ncbi:DUF4148 domain-containing protein [Rubrivivax sp. RP6-9]|uniref:DUF4148 domain-containing protein n=1 Tax=Rubrivivax sp. RP6-9 TaxID=3415750 RepID=UPI003CC5FF25